MIKIKNKICILLVLFLFPLLTVAQSTGHLESIIKKGEIRIGTSGFQPPYSVKSKDGTLMGYEIELAGIIAQAMNVKLKLVEKPFDQLLSALGKGEIDAVMSGLTITPERNLKASFVGPYLVTGRSVLAKAKRIAQLDEIAEINRPAIRVVALKGSVSQRFVEKITSKVNFIGVHDYESGVQMVLDDKADLMVADHSICMLSILRHPDSGLATLESPLTIEPVGMALPPDAFLMHNMIDNYLKALEIRGVLDDLGNKWFKDGSWLIRLP